MNNPYRWVVAFWLAVLLGCEFSCENGARGQEPRTQAIADAEYQRDQLWWNALDARAQEQVARDWWFGIQRNAVPVATEQQSIVIATSTASPAPTLAAAPRIINGQPLGKNTAAVPIGKVGCIHVLTDARPWNVLNRGVSLITKDHGWPEYFETRVQTITTWLEPADRSTLALHEFDRAFGCTGDWWRHWDVADLNRARRSRPWLVKGFLECCRAYTETGREIVVHMGGVEEGGWAAEVRRIDTPDASAEALDVVLGAYRDVGRTGAVVGIDALSGATPTDADYGAALLLEGLAFDVQCESLPEFSSPHLKGFPRVRVDWLRFKACCLDPRDSWAVKNFPKLGTPEFAAWYPDCRVCLYSDNFYDADASFYDAAGNWASPAKVRIVLARMAAESRKLVAAGCTVLIDAESCQQAAVLKFSVKEFYP